MIPHTIKDEEHWHDLRSRHIGGSEVAALFNKSPHTTYFELWHIKSGNIPRPIVGGDRVFWGSALEEAIAKAVADLKGWKIRNVHRYIEDSEVKGFGGTLDYEIVNHPDGSGVLEIKNVDYLVWRDWEGGEPPLSHILQLQSYLALTGKKWGVIASLVSGNLPQFNFYKADPKIIKAIRSKIKEFWKSIEEKKAPEPIFTEDLGSIKTLYANANSETLNLHGDKRLAELCGDFKAYGSIKTNAGKAQKTAMAEILTIIGDAGLCLLDGYKIKQSITPEKAMSFTRKASKRTTITPIKTENLNE